jgi:hypothetical protein
MKGNDDDADAMVDDKNKSSADNVSEKGGASKVIVGGGLVVGRVTKGTNDDVVVAAAVDSTTVDDDHSGGGGGPVVGPETKSNNDDADAMVDDKNKSSADDVSGKERDSDEIDLMQNTIRKQLMKKQYRELWGEEHGYRSPNSDQQYIVSNVTVNVNKANVDTVDKDETESDDVDEDEDEDKDEDVQVKPDDDSSYVPGVSLGDNDEDEDDAVGCSNDNADDGGEDELVEGVIDAEDVVEDEEVERVETNTKNQKRHYEAWVNNYNDIVSYYNTNGDCQVTRNFATGVIDAEDVVEDEVVERVETNTKNQKHHYEAWVNTYNDIVSYYNTNGDCQVTRDFATAEGRMLGYWVHDQRKKFKAGVLSDDRINLLSNLQFDFSMQTNVVGAKLTVPVAISNIFEYKKEHGNISVPNKEPHKQLRHWITHVKAASKKIIEQGSGNPNFTLPNLKLLNELGIIQLPSNFKLKETTTTKSAKKKEKKKKKTTKEPPKAKAQGARATVSRVSVAAPKKNITTPRPKANAPIQPKIKLKIAPKKISSVPRATAKASIEPNKILQTPSMSTQVSSQPTRTSPRRAATAINISHQ